MMKAIVCALVLAAVAALVVSASQGTGPLNDLHLFNYQPAATSDLIVQFGNARFTVLSSWMIRMEYSDSKSFEDRATLAVVNRAVANPGFTNSTAGGVLTIQTSALTLTYSGGSQFSGSSLQIDSRSQAFGTYTFGDQDTQNLLGTIRSLDDQCTIPLNCNDNTNIQTNGENLHCAWGVVSRGGWTTINDTKNFIMPTHGWFDNNVRGASDIDVYFLGHGQALKQALQDWTNIGGKVPIPSRPLLGSWFTRWFDYDHSDLNRLLDIFVDNGIPLDVLILDMNWHTKNAWTGFTWDDQLYPYPSKTLDMVRSRGLMIGSNIHDAQGVGPWEKTYDAMCSAMGLPSGAGLTIPFQPLNATYFRALEDQVIGPAGFDFSWTDWQQGGGQNYNPPCNGLQLNPTFLTDHVRWSDNMRRGVNKRSNTFSRFGGLGSHRYPVGFTGDVASLSWQCMSYQPFFSVSASNVAYGYPSHDLVGGPMDHELHVRWMQFGAFSGVMRIHDRGMSSGACWDLGLCAIVDIWTLPYQYFDPIRQAMNARVALLPYIYREARRAYDTGLNFVHGLYYEWPGEDSAYSLGPSGMQSAEYMFGNDIVVNVITSPADAGTELATISTWVPPGKWYDNVFGQVVTGPQTLTQQYALGDIPMLIRGGAVIPRLPKPQQTGIASKPFAAVDLYIYPGATGGSGTLYEDDGMSWDYISKNAVAWTTITYVRPTQQTLTATVGTPSGAGFATFPATRAVRFFLVSMAPLDGSSNNKCNGAQLTYAAYGGGANTWSYDGLNGQVVIDCGVVSTGQQLSLSVSFVAGDADGTPLHKAKGFATRTLLGKHILDNRQATPGSHNYKIGQTKLAGSHAAKLSGMADNCNAASFEAATGANYKQLVVNAIAELNGGPEPPPPAPKMTSLMQLYDSNRNDMVLCGDNTCLGDNSYYTVMWVEGYQLSSSDDNGIPLYDYWSLIETDNWATTSSSAPAVSYAAAAFNPSVVSKVQTAQTSKVCLQVWQSSNDHMTLGSQQALTYAQAHGYTKVSDCLAYILTTPPAPKTCATAEAFHALQAERRSSGDVDTPITAKDVLDRLQQQAAPKALPKPPHMAQKKLRPQALRHRDQNDAKKKKLGEDTAMQRAIALLQSAL